MSESPRPQETPKEKLSLKKQAKANDYLPERPWTNVGDLATLRDVLDLYKLTYHDRENEIYRMEDRMEERKYQDSLGQKRIKVSRNEHIAARNAALANPNLKTDIVDMQDDRERREDFGHKDAELRELEAGAEQDAIKTKADAEKKNDAELRELEDGAEQDAIKKKADAEKKYEPIEDAYKVSLYKKYKISTEGGNYAKIDFDKLYSEKLGGPEKIRRNTVAIEKAISVYLKEHAPNLSVEDVEKVAFDLVPIYASDFTSYVTEEAYNKGDQGKADYELGRYIRLGMALTALPEILPKAIKRHQFEALRKQHSQDTSDMEVLETELEDIEAIKEGYTADELELKKLEDEVDNEE